MTAYVWIPLLIAAWCIVACVTGVMFGHVISFGVQAAAVGRE